MDVSRPPKNLPMAAENWKDLNYLVRDSEFARGDARCLPNEIGVANPGDSLIVRLLLSSPEWHVL